MAGETYTILTDLDPKGLNELGLEIYRKWVAFAMGQEELGGHKLISPTGRYASAIQYRRFGVSRVAIMTDDEMAPESMILEEGHGAIDMLHYLQPGRFYPMHRGSRSAYGGGHGKPVRSSKQIAKQRNIWAEVRERGNSGGAVTPRGGRTQTVNAARNTSNTGPAWTIPAMPAYSPALHLSQLIEGYIRNGGKL